MIAVDNLSIMQISNVTDIILIVDVVKLAGWVSMNMTMIIHMLSFVEEVIIVLMIMFCSFQLPFPYIVLISVMQTSGAGRGFFRGGQFSSGGGSGVASSSPRPYVDRSLHGAPDRGQGMPIAAPLRRHHNSPQGHFDGPPSRGHFDGPHLRGNFDGPHPRGNFDRQHPRGNFDGPHPRGNFGGQHMRGHFDGPHPRDHFDGPHPRGHYNAPDTRGHYNGPDTRGHFNGPHMGGHFDGPHMGGHFYGPSLYDQRDRTQDLKRPFHMRVSSLFLCVVLFSLL